VLAEARRALYLILADDDAAARDEQDEAGYPDDIDDLGNAGDEADAEGNAE
jgi:hypothetical protein